MNNDLELFFKGGTIRVGTFSDTEIFTIVENSNVDNIITIRNNIRQLLSDLTTNTQDRSFYYDYYDHKNKKHTGLFIGVEYIDNKPRTFVRAVEYIFKKESKTKLLDSYRSDFKDRSWEISNSRFQIPGTRDCFENYIKNSIEFECDLNSTLKNIKIVYNNPHPDFILADD